MAIDIHAHFFPFEYLTSVATHGDLEGFRIDLSSPASPTLHGGGAVTTLDSTYWDLERRLTRMETQGVRMQALSLTMPMVHIAPPARGSELARLVNDAMAAAHARHPDRFVGCAALPLQDPARALEELERVSRLRGMRAAYMPTNIAGRELSDAGLDAIFAACERLGWPILLHPHPPLAAMHRTTRHYFGNLLGNAFDTAIAAAHLVFDGVLDRFPRLQVVLPHAGGALPWLHGRLQHGQRVIDTIANVAERPFGEYLRRFHYDTLSHSPRVIEYLVDLVGADRVLLGSDYCFNMGYERPRELIASLNIPAADRERITSINAKALLGL